MTACRATTTRRSPLQRSRVTNGSALFVQGGDGRGSWARRFRDVFELHQSDLGGEDVVSEAERSIVRRAAVLTVELERIEAKFAVGEGDATMLDLYQRTAGSLRRLLESVGLKRRARNITPSVADYLAQARAEGQ